jgi:ABC-2 type transport system permease protein/sodium transport system permease protein
VFEEMFFRGFFFTSLRTLFSPWKTIFATALLFGLFHVVAANVLEPERFLPSVFLGVVLGWVRYRSGSVMPCMLLHAVHNGLLLSLVYWRDSLTAAGFGIEEDAHIPFSWLLAAALVGLAAVTLMMIATRPREIASTSPTESRVPMTS